MISKYKNEGKNTIYRLYGLHSPFVLMQQGCDGMDELLPVTRAQLSIGLEDKSEVERQEEIKSIRFIVVQQRVGRREAECE